MRQRITNDAGVSLIKYYEGFRAEPYICPAGYLTIGYGHVVKPNEKFTVITKEDAEALLRQDLAIAENAVARLMNVTLTGNQFAALVSFAYNLGGGALQRSTLRMKVNREEHSEVPAEFTKWIYAGGRKLAGLVRRREDEAVLYMTPDNETIVFGEEEEEVA